MIINSNSSVSGIPSFGILGDALLTAPMPVGVLEGEDFKISYANEALLEVWARDTAIFGRKLLDVLPELADQPFPQYLKKVYKTGITHTNPEEFVSIKRNGTSVTSYFDYSYTAIKNGRGSVTGILVIARDVTEQVLSRKKLEESQARFYELLRETPVPTAVFSGENLTVSVANKAALQLWGKDERVLGKTVEEAIPEIKGQPFIQLLKTVQETGVSYEGNENEVSLIREGKAERRYLNFIYKRVQNHVTNNTDILSIGFDVTDQVNARKQAELSRISTEEAQQRLEMALEAGSLGYYELDLKTGIIKGTALFKDIFGLPADGILNRKELFETMLPQCRLPAEQKLSQALSSDSAYTDAFEIKLPDHTSRWVKITGFAKKGEAGEPVNLIGVVSDISEQKRAEEKQAMLAAIVNTSDDTILSKTLGGIITSWNRAAEKMFGYTEEEVIGKHISLLIPQNRLQEEDHIIGNIAKGNKVDHFETLRRTKDGREIPISLSVSPIEDRSGKIIGASKIARDISDQKKAEEKQAMLAAIVNTSDDTILSKTLKGIITSWNKAAEKMFGYTEEEVIGKHISILIPPERLSEEDVIIGNISKGNKVDHFETIRVAKDGRRIPISLSVSPLMDAQGNIIGASKIARDISAQKEAQEASLKYTRDLEIINSVGKSISEDLNIHKILQKVTDATTELTGAQFGAFFYNTMNSEGEAYTLYTLSGAPKEAFEKFGLPRNTEVFNPTFKGEGILRVDDITKDPRYGKNAPNKGMPEGHLPVKSYLAVPVRTNSGAVIGGLFFGHPKAGRFTENHENLVIAIASQASTALDNAKLYDEIKTLNAKKDEFIGLASHELKTPLTSISGYLQLLERSQRSDTGKNFVTKTIQQVNKLTSLVSELLDVSKIEAGKLQLANDIFDFREIVDDSIELIKLSNGSHNILLHTSVKQLMIWGDKQRLEQVIVNLLTNAIKYSPGSDKVEVFLSASPTGLKLGVKDSGIGIPPNKTSQIFSRFYRVEDVSPNISGLGIGLYIAKEIIDRHKGKIWVDSELGQGSTFWISLPIALSSGI